MFTCQIIVKIFDWTFRTCMFLCHSRKTVLTDKVSQRNTVNFKFCVRFWFLASNFVQHLFINWERINALFIGSNNFALMKKSAVHIWRYKNWQNSCIESGLFFFNLVTGFLVLFFSTNTVSKLSPESTSYSLQTTCISKIELFSVCMYVYSE